MGLFEALIEWGSLGIFAAFLVWQHISMGKKYDLLIERFQQQLEKIRSDQKEDIGALRDRYDAVISNYNSERDKIRMDLGEKLTQVAGTSEALQIQIEAVSLAQRNTHLLVEKGITIMTKMEEEAKLRALAKKMSEKE